MPKWSRLAKIFGPDFEWLKQNGGHHGGHFVFTIQNLDFSVLILNGR
jgi:hypothetical protein